jgi:hypothetical protein
MIAVRFYRVTYSLCRRGDNDVATLTLLLVGHVINPCPQAGSASAYDSAVHLREYRLNDWRDSQLAPRFRTAQLHQAHREEGISFPISNEECHYLSDPESHAPYE